MILDILQVSLLLLSCTTSEDITWIHMYSLPGLNDIYFYNIHILSGLHF